LAVDDDRDFAASGQIVDEGLAPGHRRKRTGIGKIDAALGIHDQIVWRHQRHPGYALGERCDGAVLASLCNPLAAAFREYEFAALGEGEAVRPVARFAHHRDLPVEG